MNVNDIPFKDFFEQSIKTICEHEPSSIALVAVLKWTRKGMKQRLEEMHFEENSYSL